MTFALPARGDVVEVEVWNIDAVMGLKPVEFIPKTVSYVEFLWPRDMKLAREECVCPLCGTDLTDRLQGPPAPWIIYFAEGGCELALRDRWRPIAHALGEHEVRL